MIKILFVCHGNICRSPMAEFVMKDLVAKAGLEHLISVSSCAATYEEIGNDTYPPVRRLLNEKGIPFTKRESRIFTPADYEESTYIIGMDDENRRDLYRLTKGDPQKKVSLLLEWTGENRSVADPWYTDDYETAYRDIMKYLVMTGEPGETIRASMTGTKGNRRFIMKDGRCPLLQEDGLCRIIMETGEENLCDICAMHPRFFVENGNFELAGVGLACEESVALLLSNSTPLLFMEDSASSLFDFPTLLSAMGCSLPEEALSYTPTINETYCRTILYALSQTEPVDEAWTKRLSALSGSFTSILKKAYAYLSEAPLPELTAVYQYIFYRALEKEPFCGIDAVMTYARQSTDFIFMETAVFGDLPENIRRWSEQIEYDTDNPDILLSLITK